jgi:hypothetical protein
LPPDDLVATASPLIGAIGPAFYFTPETSARGAELGLDAFQFYALGRGGVLGDVDAAVVVSAFGYFSPPTVSAMWDSARAIAEPRSTALAFMECNHRFGRAAFSSLPGLDAYCAAAQSVIAATNPAGLALFAGLAAEPVPADAPARAMHLTAVLREFRGSAHLLAVIASGVEPKVAHYIRRPEMFAVFGYTPEETPEVTEADRAGLARADELTDQLVGGPYSVLGATEGRALLDGLDAMSAALAG